MPPLGKEMIAAGRPGDAERFYQAMLDTMPEYSRIKLGYGLVCGLNGYVDKGLNLMQELGAEDSSVVLEDAVLFLARHLLAFSKAEDALAVCEFGAREFPDSYRSYMYLAEAYELQGDVDKALENCRRAIELNPGSKWLVELQERLEEQE